MQHGRMHTDLDNPYLAGDKHRHQEINQPDTWHTKNVVQQVRVQQR